MAVKEGYKQTEIGVIPEDWGISKLSDVCLIGTGMTPPTNDRSNYGTDYLFVSPADLGSHKWIKNSEKRLSSKGYQLARKFPAYSILFTCIGSTIGKTGLASIELTSNQQINAVYPNESISSEFLYYGLDYIAPRIRINAGQQAVPIINKKAFGETTIPIPDLKEQKTIATVLSDIDVLIDSLSKLIEKKKNIKQGAMQELLTGKKRLEGFSGEWVEVKFRDVCEKIIDNRGKTPPLTKTGIPLLETNTIKNDFKDPIYEFVTKFVSEYTYKTWFRDHIQRDDILISTVGMVGETALLSDYKCAIAQNLIGLRISKKVNADFVFYQSKTPSFKSQVKAVLMGAVQPSLKVPHLLNFIVKLPKTKEEQTAIATILSDMDSEIEKLQSKLDKYKAIKQGMMQELLTGRIRLLEGA